MRIKNTKLAGWATAAVVIGVACLPADWFQAVTGDAQASTLSGDLALRPGLDMMNTSIPANFPHGDVVGIALDKSFHFGTNLNENFEILKQAPEKIDPWGPKSQNTLLEANLDL